MTRLAVSTRPDLAPSFVEIETKFFAHRLRYLDDKMVEVRVQFFGSKNVPGADVINLRLFLTKLGIFYLNHC
jgi:hypothetical protein